MSTKPYLLLAPGPVNLHPQVRQILSEPMIHHRTPLFDQIFKRVLERLPLVFETKQSVYALSGTGSAGMETLMVNTCNWGDSILVINSGKFGERWSEMGRAYQLNVHEIKVPWGETVSIDSVKKILDSFPIKTVFCQACETSTGVKHPLKELGALIHSYPETLFIVDGITAVGAFPVPMDEWSIDGLVAGSQKAFMLPTGMCFVSFSKKAWVRIPQITLPRYYFDIREEDKANRKGESWFSTNVMIIKALDYVLDIILEKGLKVHFNEIKKRSEFTQFCLKKLNIPLFSKSPSESLTAFCLPQGTPSTVDTQILRSELEKFYNITIMGGQDQLKGKILRVGHMGYIENEDMIRFFKDLQSVFQKYQVPYTPLNEIEMRAWFQS